MRKTYLASKSLQSASIWPIVDEEPSYFIAPDPVHRLRKLSSEPMSVEFNAVHVEGLIRTPTRLKPRTASRA